MKLVTFTNAAGQSRVGALLGDSDRKAKSRIVDLHSAYSLYLRDKEKLATFERMADALVPSNMLALFQGGDSSLDAARKALDYVAHFSPGDSKATIKGPRGEAHIRVQ
jgi:hypothetical protein